MSDLILSTDSELFLQRRAAILERAEKIKVLYKEIEDIADSFAAGLATQPADKAEFFMRDSRVPDVGVVHRERFRHYFDEKYTEEVAKDLDKSLWKWIMSMTGVRALMNHKTRDQFDNNLERGEFPPISKETLKGVLGAIAGDAGRMREEGVIDIFRHLSWDYKSNLPHRFGKRVIVTGMASPCYSGNGMHLRYDYGVNIINDLERAFAFADGKVIDLRDSYANKIQRDVRSGQPLPENPYFELRLFKNGNAHILFKNPTLVQALNKIVAAHYPNLLPEKTD